MLKKDVLAKAKLLKAVRRRNVIVKTHNFATKTLQSGFKPVKNKFDKAKKVCYNEQNKKGGELMNNE